MLTLLLGVALQEYFGFGVHWGPRMLLPAAPALVGLALVAARETSRRAGFGVPRAAWALLLAAGLVSSAHAFWFLAQQKGDGERLQAVLLDQPGRFLLTTRPLLAQQLAALWHSKPMLLAENPRELRAAIELLRDARVERFPLVVPPGAPAVDRIEGLQCRRVAEYRGPHLHYLDVDVHACRFPGRGGRRGAR